ncbi:MAG: hypothetical protein NUW23_12650 [Firmicutes bacterium]|jgi:molybdopterin converting factor small subunit|nr:hypothetical protein [Bacillota bacterium]
MITVRLVSILGPSVSHAGASSRREFTVPGPTIREALLQVERAVPDLGGKLVREGGSLNPSLFVVAEGASGANEPQQDLGVELPPGTAVSVLPVVTGG